MISICQTEQVFRNVYRLAKSHAPSINLDTVDDARLGYLKFLSDRYVDLPVNFSDDFFITDRSIADQLTAHFAESALDDLQQSRMIGKRFSDVELASRNELGREAICALFSASDQFAQLFDLIIHSIFFRPSQKVGEAWNSHGGSTSSAIGAIWISAHNGLTKHDLMEMFIHELTHHMIFIDELNNPQFDYQLISRSENFALSAILLKNRPLDKVFHSILVAISVISSRESFLDEHAETLIHPKSQILLEQTHNSIRSICSLQNLDKLMTPHAISVLDEANEFCQARNLVTA